MIEGTINEGEKIILKIGSSDTGVLENERKQIAAVQCLASDLASHYVALGVMSSSTLMDLADPSLFNTPAGKRFASRFRTCTPVFVIIMEFGSETVSKSIILMSAEPISDETLTTKLFKLITVMVNVLVQLKECAAMLHQDAKPDNFIFNKHGRIVLIDYEHAVSKDITNPDVSDLPGWGGQETATLATEGFDGFVLLNSIRNHTTYRIKSLQRLTDIIVTLFPNFAESPTYYPSTRVEDVSFADILREVKRASTASAPTTATK